MMDDFYTGSAFFALPNGDTYEGDFSAHRSGLVWREGHGKYKSVEGDIYEGEWHGDKLTEEKDIEITYNSGSKYIGKVSKCKYNGAGAYVFDNGMEIIGHFEQNKPKGVTLLIDINGKLWKGYAQTNNSVFLPKNIFYENIDKNRGKRRSKIIFSELASLVSENEIGRISQLPEMPDKEIVDPREELIFTKSKKTSSNIDFTDSDWYKDFDHYRKMRQQIMEKIEKMGSASLTSDEQKWYKKYKMAKTDMKSLKSHKKVTDCTLLEQFFSRKFAQSSFPVHVIYPTKSVSKTKSECDEKVCEEETKCTTDEATIHKSLTDHEKAEKYEGSAQSERESTFYTNEKDSNADEELEIETRNIANNANKHDINFDTHSLMKLLKKYHITL